MSSSVFSRWTAQSLQKWQQSKVQEILEDFSLCSVINTYLKRTNFFLYTGIPQIARFLGKSYTVLTENRVNRGQFYSIKSKMGKSIFKSPLFVTF